MIADLKMTKFNPSNAFKSVSAFSLAFAIPVHGLILASSLQCFCNQNKLINPRELQENKENVGQGTTLSPSYTWELDISMYTPTFCFTACFAQFNDNK
jgi:hypothetical protein